jgi:prepilin-type N-terminal cleavage/methylation domain-containing protein
MRYTTKQSGFSLVETLVAITILLIVIIGPMTISSSAARSTSFASEQVTAFFLAQEGAELVEKARNELLLENFVNNNPNPWSDFTDQNGAFQQCYTVSGCGLYINTNTSGSLSSPQSCSSLANCSIYLDTSTAVSRSRYTHVASGNTLTSFTRVIFLERMNANEVKVTSTVTWRSGSVREDQIVSVETRLFNLYESS